MRNRARRWLSALYRWLSVPAPPPDPKVRALTEALAETQARAAVARDQSRQFLAEMLEAQAMAGGGPWLGGDPNSYASSPQFTRFAEALSLREAGPVSTLGVYGTYELLLQNIDWQREINFSWLEFTRWGIQQIILICRLYYIKNPIVRRLADVCAAYVFARGVDVTTEDEDANDVLKDFFERNQRTLGHIALCELEKSKDRDGNLFFVFFADQENAGLVDIRTIDATEIQDIECNPEDSDEPWFYHRLWTQRSFDPISGNKQTITQEAWYPALNYAPAAKPAAINGKPVMWDKPVYHRKVGAVGKWLFGCPRLYPMLDWAKEARRFLEACASVRQSLSQFAATIVTKGGQQAVEGIKAELQTQVGPAAQLWDTNPPAVAGAQFISGPGTQYTPVKGVQGATFSPEDVRQYKLQCCMVKGVPETFLADVSTGNLATATSLDRPTEIGMMNLQEEWVEDLTVIAKYVLSVSLHAPNGKLREAVLRRGEDPASIRIIEAKRQRGTDGRWQWAEAKLKSAGEIEVKPDFPSIREGDMPALVTATVQAMTLNNKGGQVTGIDEKEGVKTLYRQLGIEKGDEIAESQYPKKEYDPDRTKVEEPPPIPKALPNPGGAPQNPQGQQQAAQVEPAPAKPAKAMESAAKRLLRAIKLLEAAGDDEPRNSRGEWTAGGDDEEDTRKEIGLIDQQEDRNGNLVDRSHYTATRKAEGGIAVTQLDRAGKPTKNSFSLPAHVKFNGTSIALAMYHGYSHTMRVK